MVDSPTSQSIVRDSQVTVILPIRNEARYIARTLESLLTQDYSQEKIEILVVDGMSGDGTRQIVTEFEQRDSRIRLLDNSQQIVPAAMNKGIRAARGTIVIRVDGHTVIAQDYVRRCVVQLATTGADNVGGPMRAESDTWIGNAIVLATSSPFGVGGARFHYAETPGWVDTVYMGAYRREVFDRIGLFDEELVRNQDDELNFRLIQAGGKIWLDPQIRSTYYSRSTLRGLWKQYFEYGFWKVRVIQKHRRPASWRHLVPATFVLALFVSTLASIFVQSPIPFPAVACPYVLASLFISLTIAAREGWRYAPILPLAFATMHVAYGVGFLAGIARFGFAKRSPSVSQRQWMT
ncbi:MAG: glycosyltransferase family 2 protein [Chloroflexi bacterium]|nr:glycosyltransferase family 2 protein [Chloroflexota bacterium]